MMRHYSFSRWDVLPFVAGLLYTLAFAPFDYAYLALIALALLFASWQQCSPKRALLRGYLFGLGAFGLGVSWVFVSIHDFGKAGVLSAGVLTSLFCGFWALFPALAAYASAKLTAYTPDRWAGWQMPIAWLAVEYVRSVWVLDGFPWLHSGYAQLATPLAGYVPVFGLYGVGLLVALTANAAVTAITRKAQRVALLLAIALLWLIGGVLQTVRWTHALGAPLQVSLIQGNIAQDKKWRPEFKLETLNFYKTATEAHWDSAVVVWPETAVPAYLSAVYDGFLKPLEQAAKSHHSDLIVSLPVEGDSEQIRFNAVMTLGRRSGFYKKRHLLPFGEFQPWQPLSAWVLQSLGIRMGHFTPGDAAQALLEAGGYPFVTTICYEDVFGALGLNGVPAAAYLVNVTNDGWFGDTVEPHQHIQMAQMRALETGRFLLRSANTGRTAIIAPDGHIVSQLPLFTATVLTDTITPMTGLTPYARWGDIPAMMAWLVLVAMVIRPGAAVRG